MNLQPDETTEVPKPTRHGAIVRVTLGVLKRALGLPEDARLVRVQRTDDYLDPEVFELVIEHPELPAVTRGSRLEHVAPVFEERYCTDEAGATVKTAPRLVSWGDRLP